ncbi:MAG: hypothetical protein KAV00_00785 [Phycisphaerae bacterium]|nr:hypothetical protein [Phycisphaerae bacterium]
MKKTQRITLLVTGGFIVSVGVGLGIYFLFAYDIFRFKEGIVPGPTFIEDIRKGDIMANDISGICFLKYTEPEDWNEYGLKKEEDYFRFQSKKFVSREIIEEMMSVLLGATIDGYGHRNHPKMLYKGILRVQLNDSGFYYLYYQLGHDWEKEEYYVSLEANSKCSTNILGAKDYHNTAFAAFLKKYDPWYREYFP